MMLPYTFGDAAMFKHMLIPTDGSQCAFAAAQQAVELARDMDARVTFLTVTEPFRMLSAEAAQVERVREEFNQYQYDAASRHLGSATEMAKRNRVACHAVQIEHERPYETIIATARKHGCDVIAMGSHGYSGVKAIVLGNVTHKVLTHCQVPVIVYR